MESSKLPQTRAGNRVTESNSQPLDIQRVIGTFRRHLRLFAVIALVVFAIAAVVTLSSPPRYLATATVLLDQRPADVLHLDSMTSDEAAAQAGLDSAAVDTQTEVLKSRVLASQVVDQLHLERYPEFNPALRQPQGLPFLPQPNGPRSAISADPQREHEAIIDTVLANLKVARLGLTYALNVSYEGLDPNSSAALANAFVQQYLAQAFNSRIEETGAATSWLNTRLTELKSEVETADAAVQQYKISHNLMSAEGATLTEQEISNVDTQLAQARAEQAEQDARLKTAQQQLSAGSNGGDVGEALNNPVVQTLESQRAQASAALANLLGRYGPKHPQVLKAQKSLADIDEQIQAAIARVISNLKAQSDVARTRTAALAATADASRGSLASNNQASVELQNLQRDDDAAKAIYDAFLERYREALAKQGNEQPDAHMISNAQPPIKPSRPNRKLDLAISVVIGLIAASATILIAELLTQGVGSGDQLEELFGIPALGEIPSLASTLNWSLRRKLPSPTFYVADKPLSRFTECFRKLRVSIDASRHQGAPQIVALTSALPGEGKTTTSVCLARAAALSGLRVLLVDCDLRQRSESRGVSASARQGLLEVLNGEAKLSDAIVPDKLTGAMFLPLNKQVFTPTDVFGSAAMAALLQTLRASFDLILLDTAPILAVADTAILCPHADAVVFLARWRKTSRKTIEAALHSFSGDTFLAGIVLTQVNIREQALAGDGPPNYRQYGKYYSD